MDNVTAEDGKLQVLLVEDDEETLTDLMGSLPGNLAGYAIEFEACSSFDEAAARIGRMRFDLVVTDIYRDRADRRKGIDPADELARNIVASIRSKRFCPIVIFSDGSAPASIELGPFVLFADKSKGNVEIIACMTTLLETGIPHLAKRLHDELDRESGSYLWKFLNDNWQALTESKAITPDVLERLLRRRAAVQLGRLQVGDNKEVASVEGVEFYISPPISGGTYRLGSILKHRESSEIRIMLTPHCHLEMQPGASSPRANFVLTVKTVSAQEIADSTPSNAGTQEKKLREVGRRTQSPAILGSPEGRFWFVPKLLGLIPDNRYCDFLQLESLRYADVSEQYQEVAVLDAPFAEGLQSCFTRFYANVGLPPVNPARYMELLGNSVAAPAATKPEHTFMGKV